LKDRNPSEAGIRHLEAGEYDLAIVQFNQAIDKEKNEADAYRGLGISYYEKQEYNKAKEALLRSLKEGAKESATIYNILAICEGEDQEAAIIYYQKGLKLVGNEKELEKEMLQNLTVLYEEKRDYANARDYLARYVKLSPEDEDAKRELAFLQTR